MSVRLYKIGGGGGGTTTLQVGSTPITGGAVGRVLFEGTGNLLQESSKFFWDNTNGRLGIGQNTPLGILHLKEVAQTTRFLMDGDAGQNKIITFRTSGLQRFGLYLNNVAESGGNAGSDFAIRAYSDLGVLLSTPFYIKRSNGNVLINTTTDAGFKLDVNGTARVSGDLTSTAIISGNTISSTGSGGVLSVRYFSCGGSTASLNTSAFISGQTFPRFGGTNSINSIFFDNGTYNPVGGTGTYTSFYVNVTINQTGGASGITRGLHINPTITAAADFRAIEVANGITILGASTTAKASLRIPSGTAPTSPVNGDIWFDGTDLKMQIGGVTKTFTLI